MILLDCRSIKICEVRDLDEQLRGAGLGKDLMKRTEKLFTIWAANEFTRKHLPVTSINQPMVFMKAAVIEKKLS